MGSSCGDGTLQPCCWAGQGCDGVQRACTSPEPQPAGSAALSCAKPSKGVGQTPAPGPVHTPATRRVLVLSVHCCQGAQPANGCRVPRYHAVELLKSLAPELRRCLCLQKCCRSPQPRADDAREAPRAQDPRGPMGDGSLSTNQGPNPNWGQVSKVGCSQGSHPRDWTSKERENKAASCLKRAT